MPVLLLLIITITPPIPLHLLSFTSLRAVLSWPTKMTKFLPPRCSVFLSRGQKIYRLLRNLEDNGCVFKSLLKLMNPLVLKTRLVEFQFYIMLPPTPDFIMLSRRSQLNFIRVLCIFSVGKSVKLLWFLPSFYQLCFLSLSLSCSVR